MWLAGIPEQQRPKDPENDAEIQNHWDKDLGDRRQEIVFIGLKNEMHEKDIRKKLDACLIKDYLTDKQTYQNLQTLFLHGFMKMLPLVKHNHKIIRYS